ncbi:hypothetical protein ACQY0O_000488 [Thecaphora frezii]
MRGPDSFTNSAAATTTELNATSTGHHDDDQHHHQNGGDAASASSPIVAPPSRIMNKQDLVDFRAVQRTFDGAYARTALGQLSYAVVILRLFQDKFFYVGLAYCLFAMSFVPIAVHRHRNVLQNNDRYMELQAGHPDRGGRNPSTRQPAEAGDTAPAGPRLDTADGNQLGTDAAPTAPDPARRGPFIKSFVTAGSTVALATLMVASFEVALLVLIFFV